MAALPYMQLYVADYLADTAHLNAAQHGAYLLLLINYWQRGKPLSNSNERLANVARMSNEEWEENKHHIAEFFEINGDEWYHPRIERDLAAVAEKSDKARASGRASANKRQTTVKPTLNERSTTVEQMLNHTDKDKDKEVKPKNISAPADAEAPEVSAKKNLVIADLAALQIDPQLAADFLALRKAKKAPLSLSALDGIQAEATKAGITLEQALRECVMRGWQGFKAAWMHNRDSPRTPAVNNLPTHYGKSGVL